MGLFERFQKPTSVAQMEGGTNEKNLDRLQISTELLAEIDTLKGNITLNGRRWVDHDHHLLSQIVEKIKNEMMSQERVPPNDLEKTVRNYVVAE